MNKELEGSGKTLIITGAMDPLTHGRKLSDGYANLDFATNAALSGQLAPGVYVAMPDREGARRIFKADDALEKIKEYPTVFDKDGKQSKRYVAYFVGNYADIDVSQPSPFMQR